MGTLGSASIKLNLDRSQFDSDLTKLQSQDAGQIAYRIKLDTKDFERQIKGLRIQQPILIPLEIDTKTFDRQIKKLSTSVDPIKIDLAPNVKDFQEKLRRLSKITPVTVDIKVDEAKVKQQFEAIGKYAAEGFTQGFSGVEGAGKSAIDSMVKSVNRQLGIQSPSKVFKEIGKYAIAGLMQGLDSVDTRAIVNKITSDFRAIDISAEVKLVADTKGLQRQITGGLVATVSVEVSGNSTSKLSDSIADAVAHAIKKTQSKGLFGGILDMVAAPFKLASSVVTLPFKALGAGLGHTFEGLFLGAGLPLGESLGAGIAKGVNKALKGKFNANLSQIGINLTDLSKADWNLAKAIDALFIEGNPIGKARNAVKELKEVFADLKVLVAPGTIDKVVEFGKLSSAGPREFKKQYVAAAKKAKEQGRELTPEQFTEELKPKAEFKAVGTAIKLAAIPLGFKNKVMSFEAQRQIETRSQKIKVPEISEPTVTLVTGGFQKQRGRGAYEIAELAKNVLPNSHVIAIPNTYTDRKATDTHSELLNFIKSLGGDVPPGLLDTIQNTEKLVGTAAHGYNPDAIRIAAYARAVQRKYPDKPVNAVTFSGGTYPLEQAIQFDTDAGGKAKGIGLGAGLYGLTGRHNPNYRAMIGEQDPLGFPFQLLKPTKNTTIIPNFADVQSMDVHNPKRYFANPSVQGAMSEMFTGFVPPQGTVKAQEDIFSLTNRKVATSKHTARLNKFISDPASVDPENVDKSFGEVADFLAKNKAVFGNAPDPKIAIDKNPLSRTIPQLMASGDKLALDAQQFYEAAKKVLSQAATVLAKPLGISEKQLNSYEPEQQLKVVRAISKVKSEAPGLDRTVARLQGAPDDSDYSFYTRDSTVATKRTEDFKGLINYLRSQVLTDLPADIDELAKEYLKYLKELQGAIVKLVTNGEAIAPEILAQKDKLNLLSFDPIETSASDQPSTTGQKASNPQGIQEIQGLPKALALNLPATGIDFAPKPQPLIESLPISTSQSEGKAKIIEEGFKKYSETFKNQVQASQEIGDFTEVNKQIQDFIKYAARAKKELEEIRQLLISNGEIEKSDSQNSASRAKKTITNQTKKIQQELGKSGNSVDLVSGVDRELALLEKEGMSIGTNLSKGIALGVLQSAPLAIESAERMALNIIETTKETFGIQSPSKKFKQIGEHIGEGFEIGIKSSMQEANEELLRLVNSSVDEAKKLSLPTPPPPPGFSLPIGTKSALPTPPPPPGFGLPIGKPKSQLPDPLQTINPTPIPDKTSASSTDIKRDPNRGIGAFFSGLKIGKEGRDTGASAIANIFKNIKNQAEETAPILKNFSGLLSSLLKGFFAFQGVMILQNALSQVSISAFKAFVELDRLKTALNFASGGAAGGAQNLAFVRKTVDDLKIPLKSSTEGFVGLAAAARGTSLEGKGTRELFLGMADASTVLSLSNEQTSRAFLALQQALSKGKLSSEEMRQQLAESGLTGALGIAARAMGVTEQEFSRLLDTGQIISEDFLPKFSAQLKSEFGDAAKDASGNAQSAIFGVENAFLSLQQGVGEGIAPAATAGLNVFAIALKGIASVAKELGFILLSVSTVLSVKMVSALGAVLKEIILTKAGGTSLGAAFSQLGQTINNSASVQWAAGIFAVLEVVKLLNDAVNTDLVKSFNEAAKAAKKTAEEAANAYKKPSKPESSNGFGKLADDFLISPIRNNAQKLQSNPVTSALSAVAASYVPGGAIALKGASKLQTFGELERDTTIKDINDLSDEAKNFLAAAGVRLQALKNRTGKTGQLPKVDAELLGAEQQRQITQTQIKRDFTDKGLAIPAEFRLKREAQDEQIKKLNDKRAEIAKPVMLDSAKTDQYTNSIKALLEALDDPKAVTALGGVEAVEKFKVRLKEIAAPLKEHKANLDALIASQRIDPIRAFTQALRDLNLVLAEGQEKNKENLLNRKLANTKVAIAGFSTNKLASRKLTFLNANDEYNSAVADEKNYAIQDKAYNEAVNRPEFQSTLKRLGVAPDSSIAKIDDVLKNTTDEADKGILEKLKSGRESKVKFAEAKQTTADSKAKLQQTIQDTSLYLLDDSAASSRAATQKAENDKISFLKGAQAARLISEEMVNEKISRIQLGSTQLQKKSIVDQLTTLRVYHEQGKISAEEFTKRQRDLSTELTATERQEAENRLAVQSAVLARRLKEIEFFNKKAEALTATHAVDSTRENKEKLLSAGLTPQAQDQFSLDQTKVDATSASDRVNQVKDRIAQNKELYKVGLKDARDFMLDQYALNQELAQANLAVVDQKITAEEKYREVVEHNIQRIMQAEENRFKSLTSQLDFQKAGLDLYNQSLERTGKLEESRYNLAKALTDAATAPMETKRDNANRALDLSRKLKDDNLDPGVRSAVTSQLSQMGFGTNELAILAQRNQIEDAIAAKKLESLKLEQEYQRKALALDLQRQRIAAETAVYDAESAKLAAAKSKLDAEGAMRIAQIKKDPIAIESAKVGLEIANREIELGDKRLDNAQKNLGIQDELARNATLAQKTTQQTAIDQQLAADKTRKQGESVEKAEAAAPKDAGGQGGKGAGDKGKGSRRRVGRIGETFVENGRTIQDGVDVTDHQDAFSDETIVKNGRTIKNGVDITGYQYDEALNRSQGNPPSSDFELPKKIEINQLPELNRKPGEDLFGAYGRYNNGLKLKGKSADMPPTDLTTGVLNKAGIQVSDSGYSQFAESLKMANQGIEQRLDALNSAIITLANTPRSLTIQSPNPVDDAAKLMSDMSRGQVLAGGM